MMDGSLYVIWEAYYNLEVLIYGLRNVVPYMYYTSR